MTLLKTSLSWMTITYSGDFETPLFDLNERFGELQRKIYHAIYSQYPFALDAADMTTAWGASIREKFLRLTLFRGNATIELTPAQLVLDFQNLVVSDIKVVKQCIETTLEVVRRTCVDAGVRQEALYTSCTLNSVEGSAHAHLSSLMASNVGIDPSEVGATELLPVFAVELENGLESWRSTANVKLAQDREALFVFARTEYAQPNEGVSLGDRVDQQYRLISALLAKVHVQVNQA